MLEINELSYAAIITIELPGMRHPATISLTLTPPDVVETSPGEYKALRDCTLSDLQAFAEAMEEAHWEQYRNMQLDRLASNELSAVKVTLINEGGKALAMSRDQVLQHAIRVGRADVVHDEAADADESLATASHVPERAAVEEQPAAPEPQVASPAEAAPDAAPVVEEEAAAEPEEPAEEAAAPDAASEAPEDQDSAPAGAEAEVAEAAPSVEPAVEEAEAPPAPRIAPEKTLRIAGLRRPQGHPTPAAVDILINEPAMRDAQAHALSSMDREVAGMLIGPRPEKQPDGRYVVHVTDIIIARHTKMMGASVTYTPESWRYVTDKLHETYPNEEAIIVGWYHTHPGFGIFLSGMDLFIHQNFFTQRWHIALVLDPRAARMGFFSWDRKQKEVMPYDFPWPTWAPEAW